VTDVELCEMPIVHFAVIVESNLIPLEETLLLLFLVNFSKVLSHQDGLTLGYLPLPSLFIPLSLHNDLEAIEYTLS